MAPLLEAVGVDAGYGRIQVLRGFELAVPAGAVVALLGPNGAGKTTAMRVLAGLLPVDRGTVRLGDRRIDGLPVERIAGLGMAMVPEGRGVFPGLPVAGNLEIGARAGGGSAADRARRIAAVLERFPALGGRLQQPAGTLSGGEQQMLALGRALLSRPRILLVDEMSMGLAPTVVSSLLAVLGELRDEGVAVLLAEQEHRYVTGLADLLAVMSRGAVTFLGDPGELSAGMAYPAGA